MNTERSEEEGRREEEMKGGGGGWREGERKMKGRVGRRRRERGEMKRGDGYLFVYFKNCKKHF